MVLYPLVWIVEYLTDEDVCDTEVTLEHESGQSHYQFLKIFRTVLLKVIIFLLLLIQEVAFNNLFNVMSLIEIKGGAILLRRFCRRLCWRLFWRFLNSLRVELNLTKFFKLKLFLFIIVDFKLLLHFNIIFLLGSTHLI